MNAGRDPWWLRAVLAWQAMLLWCAPSTYRQRFGPELRQVLREQLLDLGNRSPAARAAMLMRLGWEGGKATAQLQNEAVAAWPPRLRALALSLVLLAGTALGPGREAMSHPLQAVSNAIAHGWLVLRMWLPAEQWLEGQRALADALIDQGDARSEALAGLVLHHAQSLDTWLVEGVSGPTAWRANETLREWARPSLAPMHREAEARWRAAAESSAPDALWLAYLYCGPECDRPQILARWLRVEPDNGYPHMLALLELAADAPSYEVERALAGIIDAPRYRAPARGALRSLHAAAAQVEPGWALSRLPLPDGLSAREVLVAMPFFALALPPLQAWSSHCEPNRVASDAYRLELCGAALRRMARDSTEEVELLVALRLHARLAGEGTRAHQAYRDALYAMRTAPGSNLEVIYDPLTGRPPWAAHRERLKAAGLPIHAPDDFRAPLYD